LDVLIYRHESSKSRAELNLSETLLSSQLKHILFLHSNYSALKVENQTKENNGLNWAIKIWRK
jgi:hypothetical protein